jgi:ATP/maltotriose-dependent transcriptional regulator MalT
LRSTGERRSRSEAIVLCNLGETEWSLGRLEQSREHLTAALAMCREVGYRFLEGEACAALAAAHLAQRRYSEAADQAERARTIHLQTGRRTGTARAMLLLGRARRRSASEL